ncbi:hypothetical protein Ahy_A03g014278 [Arachis hypogaea]|uniref:BED-type domain-containing protein n=1 Tax=Arachis hypogaea TaxID=3818 RepID=A0A445DXA6_ARAHY|nr:hypothetical protein Ahy_A03g014278 [Arachis hypogaea]
MQNSPNKKGLTSEAWKHFRRERIDGKWKAICKYCERKIGGDTKQGTKHLHDHIRICPIRTVRGPKQDGEWGPAGNTGNAGNGDGGNYLPTAEIGAGTGTKSEGLSIGHILIFLLLVHIVIDKLSIHYDPT